MDSWLKIIPGNNFYYEQDSKFKSFKGKVKVSMSLQGPYCLLLKIIHMPKACVGRPILNPFSLIAIIFFSIISHLFHQNVYALILRLDILWILDVIKV